MSLFTIITTSLAYTSIHNLWSPTCVPKFKLLTSYITSFMYYPNRVGDSVSPCLTPNFVSKQLVNKPFTLTEETVSLYKLLILLYILPLLPHFNNLYIRKFRSTWSNAFSASIKQADVLLP